MLRTTLVLGVLVAAVAATGTASSATINDFSECGLLPGSAKNERITGTKKCDRLLAGRGNDVVFAQDGRRVRDFVDCGSGQDIVLANRADILRGCETRIYRSQTRVTTRIPVPASGTPKLPSLSAKAELVEVSIGSPSTVTQIKRKCRFRRCQPPPPPPSPPPSSSGDVLWRDSGSLASWDADGGGGMFSSGAGDSVAEVADQLRQGGNVLRQRITTPSGTRAFRWRDANGNPIGTDVWFSWYIHLPTLAPVTDWWNVWQTKTNPNPDTGQSDPKTIMNATGETQAGAQGFRLLVCSTPPGCYPAASSPTFYVPIGRNVLVEVHQRFATDATGFLEAYVNGTKAAEVRNVATQYPTTSATGRQVSWNDYSNQAGIGDYTIYHGQATISANRVTDMPVFPH